MLSPSFIIGMNVFGEVWITHRSLGSLGTSSMGQIRRFNILKFVQGLEAKLDEHKRAATLFQHVVEYSV
jgi:hypothetical protein